MKPKEKLLEEMYSRITLGNWYSVREVANLTMMSQPSIYRRIHDGRLKAFNKNMGGEQARYMILGYDVLTFIRSYLKT